MFACRTRGQAALLFPALPLRQGAVFPVRALLACIAALLLAGCAAVPGGCALGPCTGEWCGFDRPEDIADTGGTPFLVVAEHSGLVVIDSRTGSRADVARDASAQACGEGKAGGIGLRRREDGIDVARVVRGASSAIEIAHVANFSSPVAEQVACIPVPERYFLNDVAFAADGSLLATHMFDTSAERSVREERLARQIASGFLLRWSADTGWHAMPDTDGVFLNGVDVDANSGVTYLSDTYGRTLRRFAPDGEVQEIALDMQPDNVTAIDDQRAIVAGGTGVPRASTRNCETLDEKGCAFPSAAMLVDFETGSVTPLVVSDGRETQGFSVAVRKAGRIWLGSAFSDRLVVAAPGAMLP